jgi:uncharacterized protein
MKLEWDEAKNKANIRKHGFDFADAGKMFVGPLLACLDTREDYGEDRWIGIGRIAGRTAVIVFTLREPDVVRVVSLRKATSRERKEYEEAIRNRLEEG